MTLTIPTHDELKTYQRAHRDGFSVGLGLRVHRALSWLSRASTCEDADGRYVFLWIAFNAAYSQDLSTLGRVTESDRVQQFLQKLVDLDSERQLYQIVWARYPNELRNLLANRYVFQPFWDSHNGLTEPDDWVPRFERHRKAANAALGGMDTARLLGIVFHALYTLRNQIIHGGATWNSSVNRDQVNLGVRVLSDLVPVMVQLMMHHPNAIWGDACYPVVDG